MELYIEYVIIDNIVINTLILLCVKATMKLKAKFYRIFISATLGTIFAVCYPLWNLSSLSLLPMKLMLGGIMVLIIAPYKSVKDYFFSFIFFILYTLLLGGACIATLMMMGTSIEELSAGYYNTVVPVGIVLLIVALYVAIIISVVRYISARKNISPFIREVELKVAKKVLKFSAFIDSGNKLIDHKTGLPVIILSISALEKYFSKEQIECLLQNPVGAKHLNFKGVHTISYSTISGENRKMIVFEADSICIKQQDKEYITNKFMVGLTHKSFTDSIKYEMLLNPAML